MFRFVMGEGSKGVNDGTKMAVARKQPKLALTRTSVNYEIGHFELNVLIMGLIQ